MANFRYYCIDDFGSICFGDYLEAPDLQAVIGDCWSIVRQKNLRRFERIEIWEKDTLLYQTTDIAVLERSVRAVASAVTLPGNRLDADYRALLEETRRLSQTVGDPAISARLTEIAGELGRQDDTGF